MIRLWRLALQYMKFGGVGLCSTAVHVGVFTVLIEFFAVAPLISNVFAFCVAVVVSFFGHFHWTFSETKSGQRPARATFLRFAVTALLGLGLNSLLVYAVDDIFKLHPLYSVIGMIFLVPPVIFAISKYWAFRDVPEGHGA
ncbi:MAG: GtrA family protein [Pseudomonadota bacterium]